MDRANPFGDFLRERRNDLGLSQAEVATRAGIEQTQVSKLERGLDARISTLMKLLTALDVTMTLASPPRAGRSSADTRPPAPLPPHGSLLDRFGIPDEDEGA